MRCGLGSHPVGRPLARLGVVDPLRPLQLVHDAGVCTGDVPGAHRTICVGQDGTRADFATYLVGRRQAWSRPVRRSHHSPTTGNTSGINKYPLPKFDHTVASGNALGKITLTAPIIKTPANSMATAT